MLIPAPADTLCLAFTDTRYWRRGEAPVETLNGAGDLIDWLGRKAKIPADALGFLRKAAERGPEATEILEQGIAARETIYRLFDAVAADEAPPADDLDSLNRALALAPSRAALVRREKTIAWDAARAGTSIAALLAPVVWSAGDLLAAADRRRIRRCANPGCGGLFVDESRNGARRWCDMASCGNRMKARRHYLKSKGG